MKKKVIYTSLPDYVRLNKKRFIVKDYSLLSFHEWAKKRIDSMKGKEASFAEEQFLLICKGFRYSLFRQVFFMIEGKCYFLDFLIPDKNIAIEIDGRYHKSAEQTERDKARDKVFRSIGIRTIRFTTEEMRHPDFKKLYYVPRLSIVGKKICPKSYTTHHQTNILKATEELKKCQPGERVEIRSHSTAFLYAISHKEHPKEGARDLLALADFYETKKALSLRIAVRFVGNRNKMKKREKERVEIWDRTSDRLKAGRVVVI